MTCDNCVKHGCLQGGSWTKEMLSRSSKAQRGKAWPGDDDIDVGDDNNGMLYPQCYIVALWI